MNRSPLRLGFLLNALALAVAWLAPLQLANAQCPQICDGSSFNTAFGVNALPSDSGTFNTAIGFDVLSNTSGAGNTGIGAYALFSNTTGTGNTATGESALRNNTTGAANTATGEEALINNMTGINNTATGAGALEQNTTGGANTATGASALLFNVIGIENTATGCAALVNNTTGSFNTAIGNTALYTNTTGSSNIAVGNAAGANLTTGSNNIDIGNPGEADDARTIRIGNRSQRRTFIEGIGGVTVADGVSVVINTAGHLGTTTSSARFKEKIKPMEKSSEAILALKPVTFRYKPELDPKGIPQFGLVAEEVEKVNPDLVARDEQGKPYTVRYEAVNAMLLNEFLKEHKKVQTLEATIASLAATVKEQAAQIQKVNDQLRLINPAPQMVLNSR